ncbi:hypothetical protein [Corynebacterium caspium]|uniref:hypothetical protein n=1 Tax=Corynebacterium caspium TaxID=234828 RepID=UPI0003678DC0|nr:hypothetical protein [Corynebacterium caspium]WKD59849.1 hypothetical protein CCASP_07350 [Corynebacterium caspium DSM 44850]
MPIVEPISPEAAFQIKERVLAIPGVSKLHRGQFGEVALLYPGKRISGLQLYRQAGVRRLRIAVVAENDLFLNLPELAQKIRLAAAEITPFPVDVEIVDIAEPGDLADTATGHPR